ncbi:MAG: Hsp33 family molecular chaperone HslO [Pseudomonadota bacterium]
MSLTVKQSDRLHRFSFDGIPVRGQWVRLSEVIDDATKIRSYPAKVNELLGQMLASVALFADNLKFAGAVALQSRGGGKLLRTLAECRNHTDLRGIAHLQEEAPWPVAQDSLTAWLPADSSQLALSLVPDDPQTQAPYQGMIPLQAARLDAVLEAYFAASEQLPTRLYLASDTSGRSAAGLLIQKLPHADDATEVAESTAEAQWEEIQILASTVTPEELLSLNPERLLARLFHELPCRLHPARELRYRCSCTKAKSDRTLLTLGADDVHALLQECNPIEVDCEFCGQRYSYDAIDVAALFERPSGPNDETVH